MMRKVERTRMQEGSLCWSQLWLVLPFVVLLLLCFTGSERSSAGDCVVVEAFTTTTTTTTRRTAFRTRRNVYFILAATTATPSKTATTAIQTNPREQPQPEQHSNTQTPNLQKQQHRQSPAIEAKAVVSSRNKSNNQRPIPVSTSTATVAARRTATRAAPTTRTASSTTSSKTPTPQSSARFSSSSSSSTSTSTRTTTATATTASFSKSNSNRNYINNSKNPFPPAGAWEEVHGNYLLRPPPEEGAPRALIHFLGGALVGAAPHITYRYLLEQLAAKGFLIVATPFQLSFDRLQTCDAILDRFERIALPLARTYGALPVIGVGHSAGALLQVLITSLFPDTPRAANALISYNSLQVTEAVPLFEELVAPFFTYVAARNATETRRNGAQVIATLIELAQAQVSGELPSNELLSRAVRYLLVPPALDTASTQTFWEQALQIPTAVREAVSTATRAPTLALSQAGVAPAAYDLLQALYQIPSLIEEVADGAREFVPLPAQVTSAARRAYRARNTLILQYQDDTLDESKEIEALLQAAGQVIRMKRPMIEINVERRTIADAGHAAPLLAPPSLELATRAEDLLGPQVAREQLQYAKAHQTVEELIQWLEASNL
ncbi:hypothetical protein ACA910_001569 [Epithemia clementina (nom. ined.)]